MADVQDMWYYVKNFELSPVIEGVDARFEERAGMSRAEALEQQPLGGEWVDTWLAVLQEVGDDLKSQYAGLLTQVAHGIPGEEGFVRDSISRDEWLQLRASVLSLLRRVSDAAFAWQFVMARMLAAELWSAMGALDPYMHKSYEPTDLAGDWDVDLRPLFEMSTTRQGMRSRTGWCARFVTGLGRWNRNTTSLAGRHPLRCQ